MTQRQLRLSFFISEFAHLLHLFPHIKLKQTITEKIGGKSHEISNEA